MTVTQRLYEAAKPIWQACHDHPFVKGIGDGTLDREKFQYFLLQDYLYLFDYARVFAWGVIKARDQDLMRDAIRRESRIELCTEGQRYFDLCRWLLAKDVLNGDMHRLNTYKDEEDGFYTRMNFNKRYFGDKNYLYPIPNDEIKRSEGGILVQNPGW